MIISTFFDNILTIAQQNDLSVRETAEQCIKSGVTGIDVEDSQVSDPRLQMLLQAGMQIASMPTRRDFLHSPSADEVEKVIRLALRYNVPRILLIPGYILHGDDSSVIQNAVEPLRYLCELAGKENITVGMEDYDHEDVPTHTIEGLNWFLEQVPALSCFFDTGNFLYSAEDVTEAYRLMKPRITSQIHCKDRALSGGHGEAPKKNTAGVDLYPCAVGSGVLPIREILTDLTKSGFDGAITAELFGSADTLGDLRSSAQFIGSCIG